MLMGAFAVIVGTLSPFRQRLKGAPPVADRYKKVTHQNWFSRLAGSVFGAIIGVLLFFGSFMVLWGNEGKINWSQVANSSTAVDGASVNQKTEGKFIAATGNLVTSEQLSDAPYLRPGDYVKLERQVEMFAWEETEQSETQKELGGGTTTRTTYEYEQRWTEYPENSSNFEYPQNHQNPRQEVENAEWTVQSANLGAYQIAANEIELPGTTPIQLDSKTVAAEGQQRLAGKYLFFGKGTSDRPQIGDLRIQYLSVPSNTRVTVFGTQQRSMIVPYMYRGESSFFRALDGDRDQAIGQLQSEHQMITWLLRLAGFMMMWIGMCMVVGPITTFLDILPILGTASGWLFGVITFGIALVFSTITILIAIIAHSLIALIVLLGLIIGGIVLWGKRQNRAAPVTA